MIHNNKIKESFACLIRQNSSTERDLDGDLCWRWSPYFFRINRRDSGSASIIWFNPLQSHWESYFPSLCWTICKQLLADSFRFECVYFMKSGVWGKVCRVDSSGTPSIRFNWPLMFFKSVRRFYWRRTADAASIIAARRASTANTKKQTNKTKHKLWVTLGEVDDADVNYVCSGPSQSLPAGSTQFDPFTPFSFSLSLSVGLQRTRIWQLSNPNRIDWAGAESETKFCIFRISGFWLLFIPLSLRGILLAIFRWVWDAALRMLLVNFDQISAPESDSHQVFFWILCNAAAAVTTRSCSMLLVNFGPVAQQDGDDLLGVAGVVLHGAVKRRRPTIRLDRDAGTLVQHQHPHISVGSINETSPDKAQHFQNHRIHLLADGARTRNPNQAPNQIEESKWTWKHRWKQFCRVFICAEETRWDAMRPTFFDEDAHDIRGAFVLVADGVVERSPAGRILRADVSSSFDQIPDDVRRRSTLIPHWPFNGQDGLISSGWKNNNNNNKTEETIPAWWSGVCPSASRSSTLASASRRMSNVSAENTTLWVAEWRGVWPLLSFMCTVAPRSSRKRTKSGWIRTAKCRWLRQHSFHLLVIFFLHSIFIILICQSLPVISALRPIYIYIFGCCRL